ncbi:MAG: twin-arginine translocation signal domain-containing protein, partial [Caldilineaceae bacterium]|nr:twin-arginine translocation signal domain-containing protein [Caldilineaceae bacterium]
MASQTSNHSQTHQLSRRTFLKWGGTAAGALTLAPLIAACAPAPVAAPGAPDESAPGAETTGPRTGGELVIGSIQEPDSLNPWLTGLTVGLEVEALIYESLT